MSSDRPSGDPSPTPDPDADSDLARIARARGSSLLDALEERSPGSRSHADGTASFAFAVAVELGHGRGQAEAVREAARLHEVGGIYGGDHDSGAHLARGAGVPEVVCEWIAATGERFDGEGPRGLAGEQISLEARIIRAACACERVGADASALSAAAGLELDPRVVAALGSMLRRIAPGDS
jgi:HD-GYP domain-containing protein (c-di-GMP phosphodiesterase class II)